MPDNGNGGGGRNNGNNGDEGAGTTTRTIDPLEGQSTSGIFQGNPRNPNPTDDFSEDDPDYRIVDPRTKHHGLTDEEIDDAKALFTAFAITFEQTVNVNYPLLAYSVLKNQGDKINDPDEWKKLIESYLDDEARYTNRMSGMGSAFYKQLMHMIKLAGLSPRNWKLLWSSVIVDVDERMKDKLSKIVYASRYQGFDPSTILKKIVKSWREAKRQPMQSFHLQYEFGDVVETWTYTSHESLVDDMIFLIITFLNRGAVVAKITKKSATDFAAVLRMLIAKYNIRPNEEPARRRRAEALAPEVITLPRIAACFAQLTTVLYDAGFGRAIVNFDTDFPGFPGAIFSPMFPSVVMKGYKENDHMVNIHPQLVLIAILNDNVLHARDRVTPLDQIWTYYLAAHNSNVLIPAARERQCNLFKVTENGKFRQYILNRRDHCIRRIRELRPHERMEDFIREMGILE